MVRPITDQDVTIGEVYRLVKTLKDEHGDKLDAIDAQVRLTNGRTTVLEQQVIALNKAPSPPVVTADGESLTIKITPKMWALIASVVATLSVVAPMVADVLKKLAGR